MAGNHPRQPAHGSRLAAGHASARDGVGMQRSDQRDGCIPHALNFGQDVRACPTFAVAFRYPCVLIETGQGRLIASRDAQETIAKDPLGIGNVHQRFGERPLAGRVSSMQLRRVDTTDKRPQGHDLLREQCREGAGRECVDRFRGRLNIDVGVRWKLTIDGTNIQRHHDRPQQGKRRFRGGSCTNPNNGVARSERDHAHGTKGTSALTNAPPTAHNHHVTNPESAGGADAQIETQHEVTRLLQDMQHGDAGAADALARKVYDALHVIAQQHMRHERDDHTLQATVLVNEAFMRLVDQRSVSWQNRGQFYALASRAMRRLLVDHARRKQADKREGGVQVTLEDVAVPDQGVDILALDDALEQLAALDARQAQIVQLRFFGGLSIEDTAQALGISSATVSRDWVFARAFLQRAMADDARPR